MWINSELSVSDEITQKTQNRHGYQNVRIRKPRSKTMISTECYCVQVSKSLLSSQVSIGRPRRMGVPTPRRVGTPVDRTDRWLECSCRQ